MQVRDLYTVASARALSNYLGERAERNLCYATLARREGDTLAVYYHGTLIVRWHADGIASTHAAGYSKTTRERINALTPSGWSIGRVDWQYYLYQWHAPEGSHLPARYRRWAYKSGARLDPRTLGPPSVSYADVYHGGHRLGAMRSALALAQIAERAGVRSPGWLGFPDPSDPRQLRLCCQRPTCDHRRAMATWLWKNRAVLAVILAGAAAECSIGSILEGLER